MVALIDGDWIPYRACFSKQDYLQIIDLVDFWMYHITERYDGYRLFLSTGRSFRFSVSPTYKANRKSPKPPYFNDVREYLVNFWKAELVEGEADDYCGQYQEADTIIVGEDKDLLTIPGHHYRISRKWHENCEVYVSEDEASLNFWCQMLEGDSADNIKGINGLGPVKSLRLLKNLTDEQRRAKVFELYNNPKRFEENYQLLRILQ